VKERIVEVAQPGPTCPANTGRQCTCWQVLNTQLVPPQHYCTVQYYYVTLRCAA
jgi:hypothetical protein